MDNENVIYYLNKLLFIVRMILMITIPHYLINGFRYEPFATILLVSVVAGLICLVASFFESFKSGLKLFFIYFIGIGITPLRPEIEVPLRKIERLTMI